MNPGLPAGRAIYATRLACLEERRVRWCESLSLLAFASGAGYSIVGRRLPGSFFWILSYIKEGKNNDLLFSYPVKNSGLPGKLKSTYFVVFHGPHFRKAFKESKGFICLLNKGCCCFVSEFFRYVFLDRDVISLSPAS